MKIAIVGSGISGLSAAYYLSKNNHVDLFEKEDHFGGHSHTIDLIIGKKKLHPEFKNKNYITSCIFKVKNKPAALYKCLGGFATNNVNLSKLESCLLYTSPSPRD